MLYNKYVQHSRPVGISLIHTLWCNPTSFHHFASNVVQKIYAKGSTGIISHENSVYLSLFELLAFESKKRTKYKRIEGLHRIFLDGYFHRVQGAHAVVCTFILFLLNQGMRCSLISNVRQWSFQGLNTNPITDHSLKSIKDILYRKSTTMKLLWENENNSKAKLSKNH